MNINDNIEENCIICFNEYNIIKNKLCKCNYYYHIPCFLTWVRNNNSAKCLLCSKPVIVNPIVNNMKIEFKNINFDSNIDLPLESYVSLRLLKYNKSINKKRIQNYIQDKYLNLIQNNPKKLYKLIKKNTNIPDQKFIYKWKTKNNSFVILIHDEINSMIIQVIDSNNIVKTNLKYNNQPDNIIYTENLTENSIINIDDNDLYEEYDIDIVYINTNNINDINTINEINTISEIDFSYQRCLSSILTITLLVIILIYITSLY